MEEFEDAEPTSMMDVLNRADMVVTDLLLPRPAEGLIQSIRAAGLTMPIIVISGYLNSEDWDRIGSEGATSFIKKPFLPEDFVAHVSEHLN